MVAICNHSFRICQTFFWPGFFWCNWSQMHSGFAFDWEIPPMGHFTCQIITNKTIIDVCFCSNKHARHLLFDVFFECGHLMRQKNLLSCSDKGLVAISQNFLVVLILEYYWLFCQLQKIAVSSRLNLNWVFLIIVLSQNTVPVLKFLDHNCNSCYGISLFIMNLTR